MREIAVSVAAVVGLFGFAALYNNDAQNRARRELVDIEIDDGMTDPFSVDQFGFHNSFDNMTTSSWKQFMAEVGVKDFEMEEDVQVKNRAFSRINFGKIDQQIGSFPREHNRRKNVLSSFLSSRGSNLANDNPNVLDAQQGNGQADGDSINYYDGADNMHPKIERMLEEQGWSDSQLGLDQQSATQTQIWFMFPAAVPLFYETGDETINSFHSYWQFVMKFKNYLPMDRSVRISIGLWAKGAVFTPRGSKLHARLPWARIERYYKKPRATGSQPFIMTTVDTLSQYTKAYGPSGANAGSNCIIFWFHHDWASDMSKVTSPSGYDKIRTLNQQCTVLHSFIGMGGKTQDNLDYLNLLVPALSARVAIDSDVNGAFFFDTIEEVNSESAVRRYFQFLRLITNRQYCRCFRSGWSPPATSPEITIMPNTEGPGWEATEASELKLDYGGVEDDEAEDSSYEFSGTAAPTYDTYASEATEGSDMRGVDEEATTPKVPEIDTCCGHGMEGVPYDSELRVCCEDGSVKPHDEYDPCTTGFQNGFY